jgi:hypothetical protein
VDGRKSDNFTGHSSRGGPILSNLGLFLRAFWGIKSAKNGPKMGKNGQKSEKIGASIVKKLIMVDSTKPNQEIIL